MAYQKVISIFLIAVAVVGMACSGQQIGQGNNSTSSGGATNLQGAGSTFVKPIMDKWTSEFGKANPTIKIDYQGGGSGAGIKAIQNQTSDFGASDAAMKDEELKDAKGGELVHIPVVLGAVVLTYNLESVKTPLKLTPELVSDIYLGKIKKWNDEKIKKENGDVALPDANFRRFIELTAAELRILLPIIFQKPFPNSKKKLAELKTRNCPKALELAEKATKA